MSDDLIREKLNIYSLRTMTRNYQKRIEQLEADNRALREQVDDYQQQQDEIIVALGSMGILPSEIPERVEALREVVDAAKEIDAVLWSSDGYFEGDPTQEASSANAKLKERDDD